MRNEWREICLIDDFLFRRLNEEETQAVEVRLLLDDAFAFDVVAQRTVYRLVRQYGRREDRRGFDAIYRTLMAEASFAHELKTIFT